MQRMRGVVGTLLLSLLHASSGAAAQATPPAVVAAVLDYLTRAPGEQAAVFCVNLDVKQFGQVLDLRRDRRSQVVHLSECVSDASRVVHGHAQQPASSISFSGFQRRDDDTAVISMHAWCGQLCGGQWTFELTGGGDKGWWVRSQETLLVY